MSYLAIEPQGGVKDKALEYIKMTPVGMAEVDGIEILFQIVAVAVQAFDADLVQA